MNTSLFKLVMSCLKSNHFVPSHVLHLGDLPNNTYFLSTKLYSKYLYQTSFERFATFVVGNGT